MDNVFNSRGAAFVHRLRCFNYIPLVTALSEIIEPL